jgi:hypothetical protein
MSKSEFFLLTVTAGLLFAFQSAMATQRPNNQQPDPKDPVVMCQKTCQSEKNNESYEACMLKCKELHPEKTRMNPPPKK